MWINLWQTLEAGINFSSSSFFTWKTKGVVYYILNYLWNPWISSLEMIIFNILICRLAPMFLFLTYQPSNSCFFLFFFVLLIFFLILTILLINYIWNYFNMKTNDHKLVCGHDRSYGPGCRLRSIFQQVAGSIQSLNKALRPFTSSNGELRLKNKWLKPWL
jgi:hypothetical protein